MKLNEKKKSKLEVKYGQDHTGCTVLERAREAKKKLLLTTSELLNKKIYCFTGCRCIINIPTM